MLKSWQGQGLINKQRQYRSAPVNSSTTPPPPLLTTPMSTLLLLLTCVVLVCDHHDSACVPTRCFYYCYILQPKHLELFHRERCHQEAHRDKRQSFYNCNYKSSPAGCWRCKKWCKNIKHSRRGSFITLESDDVSPGLKTTGPSFGKLGGGVGRGPRKNPLHFWENVNHEMEEEIFSL